MAFGKVMQYVLAALIVVLFAAFFGIWGFLLKDSRKHDRAQRVEIHRLEKELETCKKENL